MSTRDEVLLTRELLREDFRPAGGTYIHALSAEARSDPEEAWRSRARDAGVTFLELTTLDGQRVLADAPGVLPEPAVIALRDGKTLENMITNLPSPIHLDITGLTHAVWAPLVRALVDSSVAVQVIYVEPAEYKRSPSPSIGLIYDLSDRIEGIAPLPGFAYLRQMPPDGESCFVPLLGFEGARLSFALEHVQPARGRTIPVVGVPGFRPEFPFQAYFGNQQAIESASLAHKMRFAKANCPFDLFLTLNKISADYPGALMRVAPIGTKPHGLGAVLFALARRDAVELIYDNPVRKDKRTRGEARVCLYDVGAFATSDLFQQVGADA